MNTKYWIFILPLGILALALFIKISGLSTQMSTGYETEKEQPVSSVTEQKEAVGSEALLEREVAGSEALSESDEETGIHMQEDKYFQKDGKEYQKVTDLNDGACYWASAVTTGKTIKDKDGCEQVDYNAQSRSFERLNGKEIIQVRRWDNLYYSAGDYLIFEYNGTMHVSDYRDLYHPVLSYDIDGTYGIITKIPDGYMVANERNYTVTFYDEKFQMKHQVEGYRAESVGAYYNNGLMAVRDMKTGRMGFMDQAGNLKIPCEYGLVSDFANGYASVLSEAELSSYTEDGGTVSMFNAQGGQWGIIDTNGSFVIEPSEEYENTHSEYYGGARRFSEVRKDGTADFMDIEKDIILKTVQIE